MEIRYHGHATFELSDGGTRVLIDPFLKPNNPMAVATAEEVEPTQILVTHGHVDHIADAIAVAKRTGAPIAAQVEVANWFQQRGLENVSDPNLGGTVEFDGGWAKLVQAFHSNTLPGSDEAPFSAEHGTPVGQAGGWVVNVGGVTVYHSGDTCLFSDIELIARSTPIDVALLWIGGHYTMDRHDAVIAAGDDRRLDGDPDALRHFPADRDRRRGVQGRRRVRDPRDGSSFSPRARRTRLGVGSAPWRRRSETLSTLAGRSGPAGDLGPGASSPSADRGRGEAPLLRASSTTCGSASSGRCRTSTSRRTGSDWYERIDAEERYARMYGLSAFFIGEQKVADELGPIMRAAPTEEQRIFLCTQIADEARHVRFFDALLRRGRGARGSRRPGGAAARRPRST